jgi:hypothetical protein
MKGQLTMKDPLSDWNWFIEALSSAVGRPGPPSPSWPMVPTISAAFRPASESRPMEISSEGASGLSTIEPPAEATRAFTHTVIDSADVPCTPRYLSCSRAASMICSQVTGSSMFRPAASATDSRYQSSCVLAQNGTETSSSFHMAPSRGPARTSWVVASSTSPGTGDRKPGSASSGMKGGSRLMMSIERSPAARRRASCSR